MFKDKVLQLLNQALSENPKLFLIDFDITSDKKIRVVIDGDEGVNLTDCIAVSRAIEHNLDREEEDFALEVTSAGATSPLVNPRQYNKNLGRFLEVKTLEGATFEGKLAEVDSDFIVLKWKAREPKPIGKGKVTVEKVQQVNFTEIKQAKVVIKF